MAVETMPVPRDLLLLLACEGCSLVDWSLYQGQDFIAMRGTAHADGWRRRNNAWFRGACIPTGKDNDE